MYLNRRCKKEKNLKHRRKIFDKALSKTAALIIVAILTIAVVEGVYLVSQAPPKETETSEVTTQPPEEEVIKIGGLFDLTGPTSEVGTPYAWGVRDYIELVNAKGGIEGYKLKLSYYDYAYKIPQAESLYKRLVEVDGVVAIIGWGTGDTLALMDDIARDKVPYISASYAAKLTDPKNAPYNFIANPDYSTQLRAALKWVKENWKENKPPKICFMYPNVAYGTEPIPAGKEYAEELGFEVGSDEILDLRATSAYEQLQRIMAYGADYVWLGGTTSSCVVAMKNAKELGVNVKYIVNTWGWDESLVELAGEAAEGHLYVTGTLPYEFAIKIDPELKEAKEMFQHDEKMYNMHYVKGWVNAKVLIKAIENVLKKGLPVTGENIKEELESWRNVDLGVVPPISFYPDDHRSSMKVYIFTIQNGKLVKLGEVELERRAEWLGK